LRRFRSESDTPILVVSGEGDRSATVELLDLGADDYVRKPFRADELLARVRAVMRRRVVGGGSGPGGAARAGWELDRRRHEIRWQGEPLPVTAIEFRLLGALVERLGEVTNHSELLAGAWPGVPDPDPLWLKPHMARLRDKLQTAGAPLPVAIRAVGYRLDPTEEA